MTFNFDVNVNFSLFGLIIFGLLVWGGYRGYKRGGIVMGLSLFAIGAGFIAAGGISRVVYFYFLNNGLNVPDIYGSITLGLLFIGAIWFSHYVLKAVKSRVGDLELDIKNRIFGAIFGVAKFFLIVAVYSVVILNLNGDREDINLNRKGNGAFLPDRELDSYFMNGSAWILNKTVRMIKMDYHEATEESENNGIDFSNINSTPNSDSDNNTDNTNTNNTPEVDDDLIENVTNDDENF